MKQGRKRFKVSEYITPIEADIIIKSCLKERDRFILRVMWETGGRIAEVLSLVPDHIDPVSNCIYLSNLKQKKTSSGKPPLKRVFLFPESTLCKDLLQWTKDNEIERYEWIFRGQCRTGAKRGQVSTTYVWYLLSGVNRPMDKWKHKDGIATSLGIRKMKGDKLKAAWPHLFRHGSAVNILNRTQRLDVVQKQLGHSSIMTTEGYASLQDDTRKKIIDGSKKQGGE